MRNTAITVTPLTQRFAAIGALAISGLALVLTGCSSGLGSAVKTTTGGTALSGIHGVVHGGQQPISGATIQLYEVSTTGNATAAKPLIGSTITSDINGNFALTGTYTCDTPTSLVYLTATGGNPTYGQPSNTGIALMTGLGNCFNLVLNAATTYVSVNEVTTVAAVYALSGFMSGYANVGYASTNLTGITSAFTTLAQLASTSVGTAPGYSPASGITLPTAKINSLANSISACINSPSAASTGCTTLFTAVKPTGGAAPTDTIGALVDLAHFYPSTTNVNTIFTLAPGTPPFQPTLATAPADWTMPVIYTGGGIAIPAGIAIDASGNAWIANEGGNAVTEISAGAFASGTTGYASTSIAGPQALAIDATGNVWVANTGADNLLLLNSSGAITSTITTGIAGPVSVAVGNTGNIWVANFDGNSLAEFTSAGAAVSGSPFTNTSLTGPTGLAVDANGNVWVGNSVPGNVAEFNSSGVFQNTFTDGLLVAPGGIATDTTHSRVWTAATGISAITGLTSTGSALSGGPFVGGGVSLPLQVAIDGSGTVWTVGSTATGSVSGFTTAGVATTPATGIGSLSMPLNLAVDASGNLWTVDGGDNSVTQFVGLASPTTTPLVSSTR